MLRTLTGKHESDWRITGALQARHIFGHCSQPCCEVIFQFCYRSGGCGEAKCKLASANVSGIAKVTNRCVGIVVQPIVKLLTGLLNALWLLAERVTKRGKWSGYWFWAASIGCASSRTANVF